MAKKVVEIVVISDVHLGTYGAKTDELLIYLNSIDPKVLIINGDLMDIWQFRKWYFPKSHLAVLQKILKFAAQGTTVHLLAGNHDNLLRKFGNISLGNFHLQDELMLNIDGQKAWVFHGDKYDKSVKIQWLATFGGHLYENFLLLEGAVNYVLSFLKIPALQVAKRLKAFSKKMAKKSVDFEAKAIEEGIDNGCEIVICGHVHAPQQRLVSTKNGTALYLNSGDWVENLTALEYQHQQWSIFQFGTSELTETVQVGTPELTPVVF